MGKPGISLQRLSDWFERQKRILPWRDQPTLYRVWVSEIMLQQTQVVTVVPYFEKFIARFPSVDSLAQALEEDVIQAWAGLGYYSRARNLHRAAQLIVEKGFPRTRETWLEIPGVGQYTAGAILSIALNQPEAILDGNVERVVSRLRRVGRKRGDTLYKERLWRLARILVRGALSQGIEPRVLNQALMELGATVCTAKKPKCLLCPLSEICRALETGEVEAYPPRKKPKVWLKVREEMVALFDPGEQILLRKRGVGEWRQGLWDLPTLDAFPVKLAHAQRLGDVESRHVVTRHKIERSTAVYLLKQPDQGGGYPGEADSSWRWVSVRDPEVAVGSALKRTLQLIRERFPEVLREN